MAASEVAYAVGFSSPSYFSTSFKKFYNYSPAQARIQGCISENTYAKEEDDVNKEFAIVKDLFKV